MYHPACYTLDAPWQLVDCGPDGIRPRRLPTDHVCDARKRAECGEVLCHFYEQANKLQRMWFVMQQIRRD